MAPPPALGSAARLGDQLAEVAHRRQVRKVLIVEANPEGPLDLGHDLEHQHRIERELGQLGVEREGVELAARDLERCVLEDLHHIDFLAHFLSHETFLNRSGATNIAPATGNAYRTPECRSTD